MIKFYQNDRALFDKQFLSMAKEKAQFMRTFFSLRNKAFSDGKSHRSGLPILFDATCSGMQHISALTTDLNIAPLVNLTHTSLKDFYNHCSEIVTSVLISHPDPQIRGKLSLLKITRSLIKIPVMTIPYNIGLETLSERITEKFDRFFTEVDGSKKLFFRVSGEFTLDGREVILTGREAGILASVVFKTVSNIIPNVEHLKNYFRGMISILRWLNQPFI